MTNNIYRFVKVLFDRFAGFFIFSNSMNVLSFLSALFTQLDALVLCRSLFLRCIVAPRTLSFCTLYTVLLSSHCLKEIKKYCWPFFLEYAVGFGIILSNLHHSVFSVFHCVNSKESFWKCFLLFYTLFSFPHSIVHEVHYSPLKEIRVKRSKVFFKLCSVHLTAE